MSDINKETLQEKKKELEAELKSIQEELDDSLDRVKSDVSSSLDPVEYIRRHPLPVVGMSVLVGFLIGKGDDDEHEYDSESKREKLSSTLRYEAKRLVTRKALSLLSDYVDDFLSRE